MIGLIIALNVIFMILVVGVVVGLQARAIMASREEAAAPVRSTAPRRQPATRPAARPATSGRLSAVNG